MSRQTPFIQGRGGVRESIPRTPLAPLELSWRERLARDEVALKLLVTPDWLRRLARNPRHHRRILIAELEVLLEREKLALSLQSLLDGGR